MADTLQSQIVASLRWLLEDDAGPTDNDKLEFSSGTIEDGVAVDTCDVRWYSGTRTILAGANDDLDLTALTKTIFGGTLTTTFAKVKAILIVNLSTTTGEVLVLRANVANAFLGPFDGITTVRLVIGPDSPTLLASKKDGWAVTNGSADVLRINNPGATSISYKIAILGTSA